MKSLRTLAILTIGSILVSAAYALTVRDSGTSISIEEDDSGHSVRHTVSGDDSQFTLKDEGRVIKAAWNGDFKLDKTGTDIVELDDELEIYVKQDGVKERAEFEQHSSSIKKTYYLDGDEVEEGAEANEAISALLLKFLRASGLKAEQRVSDMLDTGGPAAVLAEMDNLRDGHALRHYVIALTEQADLSSDEILTLTEKISVLESDHDLSSALEAILENETITAQTAPALIEAAKEIESDHDLRQLVEAFAERPLSTEETMLVLDLYERLESSHDLRVAAEALLENDALDSSQAARILSAAADEIDSDHDLRLILTATAPMFSDSSDVATAWLNGFNALDSAHEQRLSIEAVAEEGGLEANGWKKPPGSNLQDRLKPRPTPGVGGHCR